MDWQLFGGSSDPELAILELARANAQNSVKLSQSMIQIAKFAHQTPIDIAVCSLRELSQRIGVSPVTIVRFSNLENNTETNE